MRFRPANISLNNRRHYLPPLQLTLSVKRQKQEKRSDNSQMLTGSHHINFRIACDTLETPKPICSFTIF